MTLDIPKLKEAAERALDGEQPITSPYELMGHARAILALIERVERLEGALRNSGCPPCAECQGDGSVRRSYGYIPCPACDGRG